ncbi:monovalent cation/H+ antiporter complex subunit F [Natroniella sulfidigena]|uniref:monovalent cation/H+ antiporter complex subunit F n=1 Tax=Natroniella sulfidigena TaxID=723921 RepID=UPI00200AB609|nr:monovalent cation/H+ antiporter complex subunit F [Natroniella sulfidigena]MCK8816059.1 monovalent cation/H+ antiporter complex subunit F [Natroniella sulfidigena]
MIEIIMLVILVSAAAVFFRLVKGPTVFDRIAAADAIGAMFLVILVLLSLYFERSVFVDVAFIFGLLLFIEVLIMAKYFEEKKGGKRN